MSDSEYDGSLTAYAELKKLGPGSYTVIKDIISKFLVARIKRELIISGNSVQRIAYDFNFCDQSSLGKFFKKATGMSPVAFRRSRQ